MITCKVIGPGAPGGTYNFGLCNQMFIIATTLSLAWDNNTEAVFPDLKNRARYGNYIDNIFKNLNLGNDKAFVNSVYKENGFSYSPIPFKDNMEIRGYFQSEKYFINNRERILKTFSLKRIESTKSILGIHVRRGDYTKLKGIHPVLSETDYYERALSQFDKSKHQEVWLFSDDIEWCKTKFKDDRIIFIEGNSDIEDLELMQSCNDMIIANSTFSWWGAWLNENIETVIAPKQWFGGDKNKTAGNIVPVKWKVI